LGKLVDNYSHVAPGIQEAAANRFDEAITTKYNKTNIKLSVSNNEQ